MDKCELIGTSTRFCGNISKANSPESTLSANRDIIESVTFFTTLSLPTRLSIASHTTLTK